MAHLSNPHPPQHVDVHVKGKQHKVKKPKVHKDKVCKKHLVHKSTIVMTLIHEVIYINVYSNGHSL